MATRARRSPDRVSVWASDDSAPVSASRNREDAASGDVWSAGDTSVETVPSPHGTEVLIRSASPLRRVALTWNEPAAIGELVMGDAWERSYGDLHWAPVDAGRPLPWYWAATSSGGTRGAGVRVRAGAMCSWTVDESGVTLWLDVRAGPDPVRLGERVLNAATLVSLESPADVTAFAAVSELCSALCDDPLLPTGPVIGANNWYYAYGLGFDADAVVRDAETISELTGDGPTRPYGVIDAGWSPGDTAPGGPWLAGSGSFADMGAVATRIRDAGSRPGLWFRPLLSREPSPLAHSTPLPNGWALDPSRPETLEQVTADVARFREWGYDLVKHDFSTFDVTGEFLDGPRLLRGDRNRRFADPSRTTAEVIGDVYGAVRRGAGDMTIIACNTVGHLTAGLAHVQRIGDDTSGHEWERTRRMGVNTLAFRLPQHGAFFAADADCVPATPTTPWERNRQFLDAIARTGTALFVSLDPRSRDAAVDADVRAAIATALETAGRTSTGRPAAEPMDWLRTTTPSAWRFGTEDVHFAWGEPQVGWTSAD
jgi:alpha-galactosidase